MSSYVQVYVKPNCEKSPIMMSMVSEWGNIHELIVVGDYNDNTKAEFENENQDFCNEFRYISDIEWLQIIEQEEMENTLPQVSFDGICLNYEELEEAYDNEDLDQYFT